MRRHAAAQGEQARTVRSSFDSDAHAFFTLGNALVAVSGVIAYGDSFRELRMLDFERGSGVAAITPRRA
jgi:hypothetical protein